MVVPDKRTAVVLVVLVSAMTVTSVALLGLEPGPRSLPAPASLSHVVNTDIARGELFATSPAVASGRWNAISIHFSGSAYGSARTLDQWHASQGLGGLAYHMVIGNGLGSSDGLIEYSARWQQQLQGFSQMDRTDPQRQAIDICLVGDGFRRSPTDAQMRQLVWLVRELQRTCNIPAQRVFIYTDSSTGRGRMFPVGSFRPQLLDYDRR